MPETLSAKTEINYTLLDHLHGFPQRKVHTALSTEQLDELNERGFLLLPRIITDDRRQALLDGIENIRQRVDADLISELEPGTQFYRDLMIHHPVFEQLMLDPLLCGTARSMLGPLIRLRGMTCRDNRSETKGNEGFGWHGHQRAYSQPHARWASAPQAIDCLHYLDDVNQDSGALAVLPGSHRDHDSALPCDQTDYPQQEIIDIPAGSIVMMHSNLYHRSLPAQNSNTRRRLIIVSFVPCWYRWSPHDHCDRSAWLAEKSQCWADDPEKLELIGVGGYY